MGVLGVNSKSKVEFSISYTSLVQYDMPSYEDEQILQFPRRLLLVWLFPAFFLTKVLTQVL